MLLGLFFVQRAMSYWLGRFDLLLHTDGVVFGLRYVDRILWQPGLWLLVALSLGAAAMCIYNAREGGLRIPVAAFIVVFGPALIMNFIQPVIERLWVKPDELRVERPYLVRNIERRGTRTSWTRLTLNRLRGRAHSRQRRWSRMRRRSRTSGCGTPGR